jgi:hypothetical protein
MQPAARLRSRAFRATVNFHRADGANCDACIDYAFEPRAHSEVISPRDAPRWFCARRCHCVHVWVWRGTACGREQRELPANERAASERIVIDVAARNSRFERARGAEPSQHARDGAPRVERHRAKARLGAGRLG